MTSKAKIGILIGCTVFAIFTVGIYLFISHGIKKYQEDSKNNTAIVSQQIKDLITPNNATKLKHKEPENKPVNFNKYLYFTSGTIVDGLYYHIETDVNERLKTIDYLSAPDIDGIILHDIHFKVVGYYEEDDIISDIASALSGKEKKMKPENYKKASKICRVLTYISIPEGNVLKRDSIWGGEPPQRISASENSGTGSYPSDKEIVEIIKFRLLDK